MGKGSTSSKLAAWIAGAYLMWGVVVATIFWLLPSIGWDVAILYWIANPALVVGLCVFCLWRMHRQNGRLW